MLMVQIALNPLLLLDIQPAVGSTSYSLWWLLPIALALVGIAWYIRGQTKRSEQKTRPTRAPSTNMGASKTKKVADGEIVDASKSLAPNVLTTKKTGKSKKRERRRSEQHDKSAVSLQSKIPEPVSNRASERSPTALTPSVPSAIAPIESPSQPQPPRPVNAIFEPLRDVSQLRRKPTFTAPNPTSLTKESVGSSQQSGGKFERTEASENPIRSLANRWPASATQQVKSAVTTTQRPQSPSPSILESSQSTVVAVPTAPANGLKGFVSKVKGSVATSSDSATTVSASSETEVQCHPTPPAE